MWGCNKSIFYVETLTVSVILDGLCKATVKDDICCSQDEKSQDSVGFEFRTPTYWLSFCTPDAISTTVV